ncbi:hypothetical protein ABZ832_17145 [Streptantibioticus parmotrematis]|uniref:hypothetical protein n=1 Tax=Streptantibioticus parmotrematis TaxID=2873249 RepID=UPI0033D69B11
MPLGNVAGQPSLQPDRHLSPVDYGGIAALLATHPTAAPFCVTAVWCGAVITMVVRATFGH